MNLPPPKPPESTAHTLAGIEIGGTKLQIVLGRPGHIAHRQRFTVKPEAGGHGIREQLTATLPALLREHPVRALGVGFGGPVDWQRGIIRCSHQVPGWADFPLADWLRHLTHLPVQIENDANTAALAEARLGAGQGANPVFYVTLGSGVGGGLVVNEQIYHGALPGEAEIGHLRLNREGLIVEHRCSGWAVDKRIRELRSRGLTGPWAALLAQFKQTGGEARTLAPALAAGDEDARRLLHEVADDLAFALSHVVHLCHPAVIVLGGGLSLVGEPLRATVAARLPAYVMEAFHPVPAVRLAAWQEDAVPMGALLLAAQTPSH
ncbi:MAG: ROK family protein [Verrucomicrobiae bacterium]|nr:ROK family protein [Verrucomicrobiae bacterium]